MAALLLLAAACEKQAAPTEWSEPDFAPEALAKRARVLIPAIEEVTGRPFGEAPRIAVMTPEELAPRLARDFVELHGRLRDGPRGAALLEMAENLAGVVSRFMLGKMLLDDGTVAIMPRNFARVAERAPEWAGVESGEMLDVILIHELVHVHQARALGLRGLLVGQESTEALRARSAVVEGHAQFVTARVAAARGLETAFDLMVRTQTDPPSTAGGEFEKASMRVANAAAYFEYRDGHRLVEEVAETLGYDAAVERLFDAPPADTRQVSVPRAYLDPETVERFDLDRAMRSVRRLLGETEGDDEVQVTAVPITVLRTAYSQADATAARETARHVRRVAVATGDRRIVTVVACTDPVSARWCLGMERATSDAMLRKLQPDGEVLEKQDEERTVEGADGRYFQRKLVVGDRTVDVHAVHLVDRDLLLQTVLMTGKADRDRALRLARRVLVLVRAVRRTWPWTGKRGLEARPAFLEAMKSDDWSLRWRATRNLSRLHERYGEEHPGIADELRRMLHDEHPDVRLAAVRALGARVADDDDWEVRLEGLTKADASDALQDPHPAVRAKAVSLLEDDLDDDQLLAALRDPDPSVSAEALSEAAYRSPLPVGSTEPLAEASRAKDTRRRVDACRALGNVAGAPRTAIRALHARLEDESAWVRQVAVESLGDFLPKAEEVLPDLVALLEDEEQAVRMAAAVVVAEQAELDDATARTLRAILRTSRDHDKRVELAHALWRRDRIDRGVAASIACEALEAKSWLANEATDLLVVLGPEAAARAVPLLMEHAAHERRSVRRAVYRALRSFGTRAEEAASLLEERVEREESRWMKRAAREALDAVSAGR